MARQLHKDPIEIKPQIKLFMTCNDLPNVPSNDGGTWRRIRVIDFISKFVEKKDLDPNKKNQYLMDNKLKHKLPDWGPVFAGYLVHIYREKYCKEKLIEPPEVLQATNNYRSKTTFIVNTLILESNKLMIRVILLERDLYGMILNLGSRSLKRDKNILQ